MERKSKRERERETERVREREERHGGLLASAEHPF